MREGVGWQLGELLMWRRAQRVVQCVILADWTSSQHPADLSNVLSTAARSVCHHGGLSASMLPGCLQACCRCPLLCPAPGEC